MPSLDWVPGTESSENEPDSSQFENLEEKAWYPEISAEDTFVGKERSSVEEPL